MKKILPLLIIAMFAAGCDQPALNVSSTIPKTPEHQKTALKNEPPKPLPVPENPQFVILAFDGSKDLNKWQETLDFAKAQTQAGKPLRFTYFVSGVYFLDYANRLVYEPAGNPKGESKIGFANSLDDIRKRVAFVNRAISEGHEIGSHLNGHFDGSLWSAAEWNSELTQFDNFLFNVSSNNKAGDNSSSLTLDLKPEDIAGFRAPNLGRDDAMWPALVKNGFQYDASMTGKANIWPVKRTDGLWEFPLASINFADKGTKILSMDYNFYFKQTGATDKVKRGDQKWDDYYNQVYASYLNYFEQNYTGNRAPVFIGSHFSDWNDGLYWQALKDFASEVCGKPAVVCTSYKELMEYLNAKDQPKESGKP
ncbi:MAG: hypothetical protein ACM3KM_04530 [Acidobacteriaceae bacterium]